MKKVLIISVIAFAVLAGYVVSFMNFSHEALAQDNTKSLKVAVVNFSVLMKQAKDVQKFQELLKAYNNLHQETQKSLQNQLNVAEANLKAAQKGDDFENSQDFLDAQKVYFEVVSQIQTLKDTMEFSKKKELLKFSSKFLEKSLDAIRIYSAGRFDIVFKVLNPGEKDVENMDDAMQLQIDQAKEILFYDQDNVKDITGELIRIVNNDNDKNVSLALDEAIKSVNAEIAKIKQ